MRRSELEHLIRAASAITDQYEIVVIGSQSILGAIPASPDSLPLLAAKIEQLKAWVSARMPER
jgi:hypothetical protein